LGERFINGSGALRGEVVNAYLRQTTAVLKIESMVIIAATDEATQTPSFRAMRSIEPGISRFRVWSCGHPGMTCLDCFAGPAIERAFSRAPFGSQ